MGAGSSSLPVNQHRTWSVEPPPLPAPPFLTGVRSPSSETSTITRDIEHATEDAANKASTATFDGPTSQGPSPYTTLRRKGCWQHESLSPCPSTSHSRQDSLLAFSPEIVGWPSSGRIATEMQQERMELTRTVSHLAAATQQLASAQNVTLMHLESVYDELKREREARQALSEICGRKENHNEREESRNIDQHRRGMNYRMSNLEVLINERLNVPNQRNAQRNFEIDSRDHLNTTIDQNISNPNDVECTENRCDYEDRTDSKTRPDSYQTLDPCKNRVVKKSHRNTRTIRKKSGALKMTHKLMRDQIAESGSCERVNIATNEMMVQTENLLENDSYQGSKDQNEEESLDLNPDRLTDEIAKLAIRKCLVKKKERINKAEVSFSNLENDDFIEVDEVDNSRVQLVNTRLKNDLEAQQQMIENLKKDCEVSKQEYKITEKSLVERTEKLNELSKKLDISKREMVRLLKELETFQYEKAVTDSKISNLERDLLERDRVKREESDENNSLRSKLSEESSDKIKCLKALEDAREEIKQLKKIIEDDKETSNPSNPGTSMASNDATVIGEEFKKVLTLKREARQRAIAAVSSEMERLRKELDAEKVAHSETSKIVELLKSAQSETANPLGNENEANTHSCKRCSVDISEKLDNPDSKLKVGMQEEKSVCMEAVHLTDILKISEEVMNNIKFQLEKAQDLYYQLDNVPEIHKSQILSLKKLADDMREVLRSRERQVNLLKDRLSQILVGIEDRTFLDYEDDIRIEYNRQFEDLLNLRRLYEERSKVILHLKNSAMKDLQYLKSELKSSKNNNEILEEDLKKAEEKMTVQDAEISNLESQLGLTKADCRDLQNQMSVINSLFTQMLLGASSADLDLDRLTQLLQENHDLISDMTRDSGTEAAALPKLLLDLIEQVEGGSKGCRNTLESDNDEKKEEDDLQEENIAHNLPKVWRVLLELLRCHAAGTSDTSVALSSASDCCYKSVDTPTGPQLVISVSKTYIRLKELILEKKHLEKEMNRMKQLNTHLEGKLVEQEKRLSNVSDELTKTWSIVGRMQAQHQQLHTHEKILRYELQQKRKMLQELKQELEYCREKWESARQKNTNTEIEWKSLRREFAARKSLAHVDSLNNSAESGFSDERDDESDEEVEDDDIEKRVKIVGSRRRSRKENSRAPTPDTESEQHTDTEASESKTISSNTSDEQQPHTPDEERSEEAPDIVDTESSPIAETVLEAEALNPLDQALTNVIQNLIKIDKTTFSSNNNIEKNQSENSDLVTPGPSEVSSELSKSFTLKKKNYKRIAKDWTSQKMYKLDDAENSSKPVFQSKMNGKETNEERTSTIEEEEQDSKSEMNSTPVNDSTLAPAPSIFSIGPFPAKNSTNSEPSNLETTKKLCSTVFGPTLSGNVFTTESILNENKSRLNETSVDNNPTHSLSSVKVTKQVQPSSTSLEFCKNLIQPVNPDQKLKADEAGESRQSSNSTTSRRSPDEVLAARAARLKRLEEQADWLVKKMSATSRRGSALNTRLEELHETYGSPPGPPPMPDVLPTFRLQAEISPNPQESPTNFTTLISVKKNSEDSSSPDDVP